MSGTMPILGRGVARPMNTSSIPMRNLKLRQKLELACYLVIAGCLAAGALVTQAGTHRPHNERPPAVTLASLQSAATPSKSPVSKRLVTWPIEEIQVGDRTLGENPDRSQVDENEAEPDPETWRKISLHLAKNS